MATVQCSKCGRPIQDGDTVKLKTAPPPSAQAERCPSCAAASAVLASKDTEKLPAFDQTWTVDIL